jgi:hypothetical protein
MYRRTFILAYLSAWAACFSIVSRAAAWELITQEELKLENSHPHPAAAPKQTGQPGAPTIEVKQPDISKPVKAPVSIKILFNPQIGAAINPKSFRATYGWLGIDITDRILAHAQINSSGLTADNADIPPGQYRVTLQIADNQNPPRVGVQTISFTVV